MNKYIKLLYDKRYRFNVLASHGYFNRMEDKLFLEKLYKIVFKKNINWEMPNSFNEKLQWLKIYNRNPQYTMMVDKYNVKKYISETIGEQYVIPTLGVYDSFDDINFDILPSKFVIKTTHDSGGVVICKNKNCFNFEEAKRKINKSLSRNYYYTGREWPYKNVRPQIIVEKYMEDTCNQIIDNWKFFCTNGKPFLYYKTVGGGHSENMTLTFLDINTDKRVNLIHNLFPVEKEEFPIPEKVQEMKSLAAKLSEGIPFVRVDFYLVNDNVYFGELTFFPDSGFQPYHPEGADEWLGSFINLPI